MYLPAYRVTGQNFQTVFLFDYANQLDNKVIVPILTKYTVPVPGTA